MPPLLVKTELHVHTITSFDSRTTVKEVVDFLQTNLIDCVGITDHATIDIAFRIKELFPERVIIGEEIQTTQGEIIGLFLEKPILSGLSPFKTIEEIRRQGGVVYLPHPFDKRRSGIYQSKEAEKIIQQSDIIETFNARVINDGYNKEAAMAASNHRKRKAAGSDAHVIKAWGSTYQIMPQFTDAQSFLVALDDAKLEMKKSALKYLFNPTLNKWLKKFSK